MESSTHPCVYLIALSVVCACVSSMPTLGPNDPGVDLRQPPGDPTPSRSWSGMLRGPRRSSIPSRFDTQLVDLNRNPSYYNYHILPEQTSADVGSPVWDSRPRQRRSPDLGPGRRFGGLDAGFSADDILSPPRFRDEQPREPERTPWSDLNRSGCIEGGPSCIPKSDGKYLDFYS